MPRLDPTCASAALLDEARALVSAAEMVAARLERSPTEPLADIAARAASALQSVRGFVADALVSTALFDRERGRV